VGKKKREVWVQKNENKVWFVYLIAELLRPGSIGINIAFDGDLLRRSYQDWS